MNYVPSNTRFKCFVRLSVSARDGSVVTFFDWEVPKCICLQIKNKILLATALVKRDIV